MNHKRPKPTTWYYDEVRHKFIVEADTEISVNHEVFNSYGIKSNCKLLLGYGFLVEDNEDNEYTFTLKLDYSDSLYYDKYKILEGEYYYVDAPANVQSEGFE
jgi:hypothetical protein